MSTAYVRELLFPRGIEISVDLAMEIDTFWTDHLGDKDNALVDLLVLVEHVYEAGQTTGPKLG